MKKDSKESVKEYISSFEKASLEAKTEEIMLTSTALGFKIICGAHLTEHTRSLLLTEVVNY